MATTNKLAAEVRAGTGSAAARRLLRTGWMPANLNKDGGGAFSIQLKLHEVEMLLRRHSGESLLVDLELAGQPLKALIKDVQHDPLTQAPIHVDFVEVSMTRKMRVSLPIVLVGDPVGVITEGGILEQILRSVEVECLPGDLVERIEADVSGLKLNHSLRVGDLKIDAKLTVVTPANMAVAAVAAPKAEEEVKPAEGEAVEGEAAAEPEVISDAAKRKAADGEEEAAAEKAPPKAKTGK